MSSGLAKDTVSSVGVLAVHSSMDLCKGCRRCCTSLIKTVAQSRLATAIVLSLPMICVSIFLIYMELYLSVLLQEIARTNREGFYQYKILILSPIYTLAALNYLFGILGLVALKCEYQNLLRFSAFVHRGVAHWILLTIFLLMAPIGGYLPVYIIFQIMLWSFLPASLWLFVAAVMTGHSDLIIAGIESRLQTFRNLDEAYSKNDV